MADPFIAEIRILPFNFAPRGWAWCDGQLLPLAQNTALFSLLGTTYGGDGRSNFALPDLRERSPLHAGQGPGLAQRSLGEAGGQATVTLAESQLPAHSHNVVAHGPGTTGTPSGAARLAANATAPVYGPAVDAVALAPEAIGPTGGGVPHANRQPYLACYFAIALQGVFPPRS